MPHVVFNLGALTATGDVGARQLIPGVEPGMGIHNIFARQRMKRVLLIQDAWTEPIALERGDTAAGEMSVKVYLKLSQESGLNPGIVLPISSYHIENVDPGVGNTDQPVEASPWMHLDLFRAHGSIWAPLWVGVRMVEVGTVLFDIDVHLDFEVVEVPWPEWFIKWDFLDNAVDNERQY